MLETGHKMLYKLLYNFHKKIYRHSIFIANTKMRIYFAFFYSLKTIKEINIIFNYLQWTCTTTACSNKKISGQTHIIVVIAKTITTQIITTA